MNTFWEKIEEGLAGEFKLRALTPALAFWGIGLVLWGLAKGWDKITDFLTSINATQGIILAVGLLFLLELSTWFGNLLKMPVLRFLEGYWRMWAVKHLREWMTERVDRNLVQKRLQLDKLSLKDDGELTIEEKREFKKLETETNRYPEGKEFLLPTQLGNLLRASEQYSHRVYGLEILTVFPRLWLIMPEGVQKEVSEAREHLDNQVKLVMLGVALFIWSFIAWWVIPIGIAIGFFGYWRSLRAAETYGLLLRASFDLYRFDLFTQLHLDLPDSPEDETEFGIRVTQALARGFKNPEIVFKHPEK